jgi:CBS domain containing-hemolysin-like protein
MPGATPSAPGVLLLSGIGLILVALAAGTRTLLDRRRAQSSAGGALLEGLREDARRTLPAVALLHALGLVAWAVTSGWLLSRGGDWRSAASLVLALLAAEVLPRLWSGRWPSGAAVLFVAPAAVLVPLLAPLSAAWERLCQRAAGADASLPGGRLREEDLRELVGAGDENGRLEQDEIEMIAGIFELGETRVREVMVPRIDVVAIPIDATLDETLETIIGAGHSRIPVYRETMDDIAGLLYAKDLLRAFRARDFVPRMEALLREAYFVPESKPVDQLLAELQRRKVHMAIVVDEYGGTAGLVTIEDLLEEIVGEIQDEYDVEEERARLLSEDEGLFYAGMDIDDVNRLMAIRLPTDEVDTLAGLVFTRLGKVPDVGDRAQFDDAEIEVLAVDGRRIQRVRVLRSLPDGDAEVRPDPDAGIAADAPPGT